MEKQKRPTVYEIIDFLMNYEIAGAYLCDIDEEYKANVSALLEMSSHELELLKNSKEREYVVIYKENFQGKMFYEKSYHKCSLNEITEHFRSCIGRDDCASVTIGKVED